MIPQVLRFFIKRHLVTNLLFVAVLIGGVLSWQQLPKEELPDVTMDTVRVFATYPGASAEEVEYHVTRPMEEALRDLEGVYRITSSTAAGTSTVNVELEKDLTNKQEVIADIRNQVLDVDLPDDIITDPQVRVFKTSRKAIIDIGLYYKGERILNAASRRRLQEYALALENRLLNLPEVSGVNRSGYLKEELQIKIYPEQLRHYDIPMNVVMREITTSSVRQPAGTIENIGEPRVTLDAELTTTEELEQLPIQGGFEGNVIRLGEIAEVEAGYEKSRTVLKVNGHEGVMLNVVKSSRAGIIRAVDAVQRVAGEFAAEALQDVSVEMVVLDDESTDVRNRIRLIVTNGGLGFVLILIALFLFLDFRSGLWVAAGIPFSFCFALIGALWVGYSVNNITLAAVIIVMGMVVDDAIVVSENVNRMRQSGMDDEAAAEQGAAFVFLPVIASILTTCIAFVPLLFFTGRFAMMARFIPAIVFLMLGGSLIEALVILPGHLTLPLIRLQRMVPQGLTRLRPNGWFSAWEAGYERFLGTVLKKKLLVLAVFMGMLLLGHHIATQRMKYVLFPEEDTSEIFISAQAPEGATRYETARLVESLEDILKHYIGKEVIGFRTTIARGRRGAAARENVLRMRVEIVPRDRREKTAAQLIAEWQERFKTVPHIKNIRTSMSWHGQDSASPIELMVRENDDRIRRNLTEDLAAELEKHPALTNVEIDRPVQSTEYRLLLDRDMMRRLAIIPSELSLTLRAALEGRVLYEFSSREETVYVRLTTVERAKDDLEAVLNIPVENQHKYLVPLGDLVRVEESLTPDAILREEGKRTTAIYADLKPGTRQTPLEIADYFEKTIFGTYLRNNPSAVLEFTGEVKDTRESGQDFSRAVIMVIFLIYIILALLFNSLSKPFIIMVSIPFGIVGIVLAFWLHGISTYGFFAVIGAIGLAGVVVNDAIIMVVKLDKDFDPAIPETERNAKIAAISRTRLRAVLLTTITTVAGVIPTAYSWAGYDAMLVQMMLALGWGLIFGTAITLVLIPCLYSLLTARRRIPVTPVMAGVCAVAVSLLCAAPAAAQKEERVLSLEGFITLAAGRDPEFQRILIERLSLQYQRKLRLPAADLVLDAAVQHSLLLDREENATEQRIALSKLFPRSGTEITAAYQTAVSSTGTVRSDLSILLSQPIAENAFGRSTRLLDEIIGIEVQIAQYQIVEAYEDYFAALIQTYYSWYEAWERLRTAAALYEKNLELLENIRQRRQSRIALPVDVHKIELQVLAKKENLVALRQEKAALANAVKQSVRWDAEADPVPALSDQYGWVNVPDAAEIQIGQAMRTARVLKLLEEKIGKEARRAASELLPSTRLFAGYAVFGDRYSFAEEERKAFIGVAISLPLPAAQERAGYRVAKIAEEKTVLTGIATLRELETRLRNLAQRITAQESMAALAEEKVRISERILAEETRNYTYGKVGLNDLIDEMNRLEDNRFNHIQKQVELRRSIVEWLRITDQLVGEADAQEMMRGSGI